MAKPKQRKWTCPKCESSVLGPQVPRQNDVRRYCLDCSAKTGRLVERVCRAKTKEQETTRERRKELRKKMAAEKKDEEHKRATVQGLDLRKDFDSMRRRKIVRELWSPRTVPKIVFEKPRKCIATNTSLHIGRPGAYPGSEQRRFLYVKVGIDAAYAIVEVARRLVRQDEKAFQLLMEQMYDVRCVGKKLGPLMNQAYEKLWWSFKSLHTITNVDPERLRRLAELGDTDAADTLARLERRRGE